MKKLLFSFFFLTFATVVSVEAHPVEGILGRWIAQETVFSRGVDFQLAFDFQTFSTALTVKCLFHDGAYLEAQTAARVVYQGNDIYIQESRQSLVDDRIHFCRATLQPSIWSAYFDGTGRIVLFVPVPYQARFSLVRDDI